MVARLSATATHRKSGRPRALVLAPTRELVNQINDVIIPLAHSAGLNTVTVFGGVSQVRQVNTLTKGVDIVVACPGRLEDLIGQGFVSLDSIEITVIDEADHMADLGFLPAVTRLLKQIPHSSQKMLFSATLDNGVDRLVAAFLTNAVLHSVDDETSHVDEMTHHVFEVSIDNKKALIRELAAGRGKGILFTRTKHQAKKIAKQLTAQGIPAVDLHGNLSQSKRDKNLAAFGSGKIRVLVATDVAARGVHVDSVELVVHVDPPAESKSYLHRSGRTARAGHAGDVVTIVLPEQRKDTAILLRKASINIRPVRVIPSSTAVADLVGERAPYVKPIPQQLSPGKSGNGKSQGTNAQRKRAARMGKQISNSHRSSSARANASSNTRLSRG